jgi:hypothetical protein
MWWHVWRKIVVIGFCLATASILACIAALLDVLVPRWSLSGFVASMVALGAAVALVVIGYAWICEKCEDYLGGCRGHLCVSQTETPGAATSKKPSL